ncbi:MAG: cupin domain-containing protein [Candidatus Omnitrophota bacterium]
MTLGEKIRGLIKESGYKTLEAFYADISDSFAEAAFTKRTLMRILSDSVNVRVKTLGQIALVLDTNITKLKEGTDAQIIEKTGLFEYNKNALLYSYRNNLPFIPQKLTLKSGGRTSQEQDPLAAGESIKWIMVLSGEVTAVISGQFGEEKISFKKGGDFVFDARQKHYFENPGRKTAILHIVHYPARNSDFHAPKT